MYDYIIVGQGIAGSLLAHFLLKQHKKIIVIDKSYPNSSSNIAAGVVNPITGRKMVKSWLIDEALPFAKSTYNDLEMQLNVQFFYNQEIYKVFANEEDIQIWNNKKNDNEYKNYLGEIVNHLNPNILSPYGVGVIKECCWMDVPVFIKAFRNYLLDKNCLVEDTFDYDGIQLSDKIIYKNIISNNIIFCEGYKAHLNPYFNFVQFSLAKGEQFTIYSEDLKNDKILNKNIFIIPKEENSYTVGSTFIWNDMEETVTDAGRMEVMDKLNRIVNCSYRITSEIAGIRPTIKDRRPVIGTHPQHKNMHIFNGFGTKGVSLAPYFADYFSKSMDLNVDTMKEINVTRFL